MASKQGDVPRTLREHYEALFKHEPTNARELCVCVRQTHVRHFRTPPGTPARRVGARCSIYGDGTRKAHRGKAEGGGNMICWLQRGSADGARQGSKRMAAQGVGRGGGAWRAALGTRGTAGTASRGTRRGRRQATPGAATPRPSARLRLFDAGNEVEGRDKCHSRICLSVEERAGRRRETSAAGPGDYGGRGAS